MVNSFYSFNSCSKKTHPHGKIRVHLCHLWENKIPIRMVNSLYSFNSCSKKLIRMAKSVSIRVHPCAQKHSSVGE